MCSWQEALRDLIDEDRQRKENGAVIIREALDSFCGKQHFQDVVIPALREIEKIFKDNGSQAWIHWEANRAWLTIGYGAKVGGKREYTKEVKYQVEVLGHTMKSRLYLMMNHGPQKEYPIADEHELAGEVTGANIAGITSKDITDDFMSAFEAYVNRQTKS